MSAVCYTQAQFNAHNRILERIKKKSGKKKRVNPHNVFKDRDEFGRFLRQIPKTQDDLRKEVYNELMSLKYDGIENNYIKAEGGLFER